MNDDQQVVREDIVRCGWHVILVGQGDPGEPAFGYTIGLIQSFQHPEMIIVGLGVENMHVILNNLGDRIRGGSFFSAEVRVDGVLESNMCKMDDVDPFWIPEYLDQALRYYGSSPVTAIQCLWPDKEGRFPSDAGYSSALRQRQPWLADTWHFEEPYNTAVFTSRQIISGELPVLMITHDEEDGAWQFLPGTAVSPDDGALVSLESMIKRDKSLLTVASLPLGWKAERRSRDEPWERSQYKTTDDF